MTSSKRWNHLKLQINTFRFRVLAFTTAIAIGVSLLVMTGMRTAFHWTLQRDLDMLLVSDLDEMSPVLSGAIPLPNDTQRAEWNRKAKDHRLVGWYVRVLDKEGMEVWASEGTPVPRPIVQRQREDVGRDWHDWRVMQREVGPSHSEKQERGSSDPLASPSSLRAYLEVGADLDFIYRDLARLDRVMLALGAAIVTILPLIGWWASTLIMAPLDQLTQATDQLQPTKMDVRLPIRGSGDNLDQLAITINSLLSRVQGYLSQREDWLANSAHELRSPIAAISSCVQVVMSEIPEESESSELLEHVLEECQYLGTLVNQLLLLSEVDADKLKFRREPVPWTELVRQATQIYEPLAHSRMIQCHFGPFESCLIDGNANHLRQVIHNLLGNAIQYTPEHGSITVQLKLDSEEKWCSLTVADTGKGISPEDLPRVIERFYRGDSSRDPNVNPRGTGLGLSICQSVTEAHGGTIQLASELGKGTTVTVRLPIYHPPSDRGSISSTN